MTDASASSSTKNEDDPATANKPNDDAAKSSSFASKFSFNLFSSNKDDDESNQKLMDEKVLNQHDVDEEKQETETVGEVSDDSNDKMETKIDIWGSIAKLMTGGEDANMDTVVEIMSSAIAQQEGELSDTKSTLSAEDFKVVMQKVYQQLKGEFDEIPVDKIDPLAFVYYLEGEDSRKNPSWKRRLHRFMPSIKKETVYGLHDALYMAQLAYADTVEDVQTGLDNYKGAKYELVYCTTEGLPHQPAHFIVIKKEGRVPEIDPDHDKKDKKESIFPVFSRKKTYLEIVLVVRGTKTLEDMVSDAMLKALPYRDGCAHEGVCESGKYLVKKHTDLLLRVLKMSGRDKIKLTLLGHSLGAGAASIACIEFNDQEEIEASCIGFGCPALVNKEMSEKWKDRIITVVSDSDCVSRMSGATAANLLMDLCEFEYKKFAKEDVTQFVNVISENVSFLLPSEKKESVLKWFSEQIDKNAKPLKDLPRREVVLFPPGKCVHFYRDGVGISAVEVPCTMFSELDVTRTMVDDHLIATGYNFLLLETMRSHLKDSQFEFHNDVLSLDKMVKGDVTGDDSDNEDETEQQEE